MQPDTDTVLNRDIVLTGVRSSWNAVGLDALREVELVVTIYHRRTQPAFFSWGTLNS